MDQVMMCLSSCMAEVVWTDNFYNSHLKLFHFAVLALFLF